MTVHTECGSCDGTGLYRGFAEPKGTAVVCIECGGSGCKEMTYKPFTTRKYCEGVRTVSRSRGTLIGTGVGKVGNSITYDAFQRGQLPH